jgi:orotidine-5'-phosphate decarboxylase
MPQHFGDALVTRVRDLGHPLCVGLDPLLDQIPACFREGSMKPSDPATATSVEAFLIAVVDRLAGRVAIAKPQIAFFEQLGPRGVQVLERICARLRGHDVLVLLDAKRGDIGSTAEGYAQAYLASDAPIAVDAITLNPYLGLDSLGPFVKTARGAGRGLFVLVRTSNPGSGDFQDQLLSDGRTLYEAVAAKLAPPCDELRGPATGWSSLGVVAGATWPEQAARIRGLLPSAVVLVPGYGAQGASAADAVRSFVPGPKGLEGGIVNSARAILYSEAARHASNRSDWQIAFDRALDAAIAELRGAVLSRLG